MDIEWTHFHSELMQCVGRKFSAFRLSRSYGLTIETVSGDRFSVIFSTLFWKYFRTYFRVFEREPLSKTQTVSKKTRNFGPKFSRNFRSVRKIWPDFENLSGTHCLTLSQGERLTSNKTQQDSVKVSSAASSSRKNCRRPIFALVKKSAACIYFPKKLPPFIPKKLPLPNLTEFIFLFSVSQPFSSGNTLWEKNEVESH